LSGATPVESGIAYTGAMTPRNFLAANLGGVAILHCLVAPAVHHIDLICPRPGAYGPELPACGSDENGPSWPPRAALQLSIQVINVPPRFNAALSQELLVIRQNHKTGEHARDLLQWGLIPYWCQDPKGGRGHPADLPARICSSPMHSAGLTASSEESPTFIAKSGQLHKPGPHYSMYAAMLAAVSIIGC
jgi:hypothetical protein